MKLGTELPSSKQIWMWKHAKNAYSTSRQNRPEGIQTESICGLNLSRSQIIIVNSIQMDAIATVLDEVYVVYLSLK